MDIKRLATLDAKEHLTLEEYIEWQRLRLAQREEGKVKRVVSVAPVETEPPGFSGGKWRGMVTRQAPEPKPGSAADYSRHHYVGHIHS